VTLPISGATRVFALLGDPVSHSLSPRIHNAALAGLGMDAVYAALRCGADDLPGLLRGIAHAGGGGNVTVPHKALAAAIVERPSPAVLRTGACNTFWLEAGVVAGENTDVEGVRSGIDALLGAAPRGARVLLLGAGGAAAAALCAVLDGGAGRVVIANRSGARAAELARRFADPRVEVAESVPLRGGRFDLAINATTLGMRASDPVPMEADGGPRIGAAFDLVYAEGGTRWIRELAAAGIPAADGVGMLVAQAAAAFRCWWGRPAPIETMRRAVGRTDA
jgi:shikimate dehydrogenase